jgi:hypothetical protein
MRRRVYAAVGIVAVLAVGACSHDSSGRAGSGAAMHGPAFAPAGSAPAAGLAPAEGKVTADSAGTGGGAAGRAEVLPLDDGVYKIRTAQLTVAVRGAAHVAQQADQAIAIAERAGGEVDSDDRTSGRYATATLQLRVPPDALNATLSALSALGTEKTRQLSTTDVTQKVADVDSRVASARESIARLRTLYADAHKVADIIAIESELSRREADLESLEAQQHSLARQTSMATIALSLVTAQKKPAPPAKHHKERGGFLGGLQRGWDGFAAAAGWVAAAIGTVLPFLLLLFVVAVGIRLVWPRLPRRHGPTPAPTE